MKKRKTLGVIGGGTMAQAIVRGAIATKYLAADEIVVSEPDEVRRAQCSALGTAVTADNAEAAASCRYLLIAVKPQAFPAVAQTLCGKELPVLISIMAGKTIDYIKRTTGAKKVARVMPNLPCAVGAGMAGLDTADCSDEESRFVRGLFCAVGAAEEVGERLLDAVTGISGSGPAYVYLFLRALIRAGEAQGMTPQQAKTFALQTVEGGVKMAKTSENSLDELIAAVSSKGGTTLAALESFRKDGFEESVARAVDAAVKRSKELSE